MNTAVDKQVFKDVDKFPKYIQEKFADELEKLKAAATLKELVNVRHLEGTDEPYYRMKFGRYRCILYYNAEIDMLEVISITHRKDAYKKHNLPWR